MKYVETISYTVALQEIDVRDFPHEMGRDAPVNPPAPPLAVSYAGDFAGGPASADFSTEAAFGIQFLLRMWDDRTRTLYYQTGNSQDWSNFSYLSDYDVWRLLSVDGLGRRRGAGATEFFFVERAASKTDSAAGGRRRKPAAFYLAQATQFARKYIDNVYQQGAGDTLNLYDMSGLAHFELYRALRCP
jgi:hypothetical protein